MPTYRSPKGETAENGKLVLSFDHTNPFSEYMRNIVGVKRQDAISVLKTRLK
jgi:hypothetical protein